MKLTLKDLKRIPHLELRNVTPLKGVRMRGVSTDSRTVLPGEVFVAIRGERMDGHAYLAQAFERGAAAAIVDQGAELKGAGGSPVIVVEDTVRALGQLARLHRDRFRIPVIAVAGSNGKTTTKDMIARVLSTGMKVLATSGNHNNRIGVPLTLFQLTRRHEIAVVEVGTNHPGELAELCDILAPTHAVVTTIGREHLEFFGSLDGVAEEEGEVFHALRKIRRGTAYVMADDPAIPPLAKRVQRRVRYGFSARKLDVTGTLLGRDRAGCPRFGFRGPGMKKQVEVTLAVPGDHQALNALAAAAVGMDRGIPPRKIRKALGAFRPTARRMEVFDLEGVLIYNDTYNANPDSMIAALKTLASAGVSGKRIAVLGDMRELGSASALEHARVGTAVKELRIDYLLTVGRDARYIHDAASMPQAMYYEQKNVLAEYLAELIAPGDAVLIKGSRGMMMEDIVAFLQERLRSAVVPFG
jgi:UDP-N-acetylmuramoyl-tripeptide--D-alanyl-D-alanine ligase